MTALRTDYQDDVLDTSVNTQRRFVVKDAATGTILNADVIIEEITNFTTEGDELGANIVNTQNAAINQISEDLTDTTTRLNNLRIYVTNKKSGSYSGLGSYTATRNGTVTLTNENNYNNGNILINGSVVASGSDVLTSEYSIGDVITFSGGAVGNAFATFTEIG